MRSFTTRIVWVMGLMLGTWGCSADGSGASESESPSGSLRAAIELSDVQHDVTGVRLDIVAPEQDCGSTPLASKTSSFETEVLPASLSSSGTHAFADAFFVLAPGSYRVCANPLAGDAPSAECDATSSVAEVSAAFTTEIVLVSQCQSEVDGGLDTVVTLNDRPRISELVLDPSKFISVCESVQITAVASDPNGDALEYSWAVSSGPDGSSLRADGASASFSGPAGDYTLTVTVDDGHGGSTFLIFPIHVADAVCAVPAAVQNIFTARCSPCHTVNSSGGLHLDPATASYANLVGVHAAGAACTDRVRVVPGDSAASYLIAKLRGDAGICGVQMPRGRPPLPAEEIQTIADWIDGLPH